MMLVKVTVQQCSLLVKVINAANASQINKSMQHSAGHWTKVSMVRSSHSSMQPVTAG